MKTKITAAIITLIILICSGLVTTGYIYLINYSPMIGLIGVALMLVYCIYKLVLTDLKNKGYEN